MVGTGEPAFTSSSNNTQFVSWNAPSGSDAYRLTAVYTRDGVEVNRQTITPQQLSGTTWLNWAGIAPLPLEEGHNYAICVKGAYSLPNDSLFFPDGVDTCQHGAMTGKRTSTTIDRSKPVVSIQAAGGAAATSSTLLPLRITYEDAYSAPNPANFLCVAPGADAAEACESRIYGYDAGCSQPAASNRSTTFTCQVETAGINPPDGRLFACVVAADSAVPDKPNSPDQSAPAGQANLSEKTCTSVVLDRTDPTASFGTPATVTRGQELPFTAQVADAHSGVKPGSVRWVWNDGSPASSGNTAAHAFTAAGTYTVQLEVVDLAGNKTTVSREITVLDPPNDRGRRRGRLPIGDEEARGGEDEARQAEASGRPEGKDQAGEGEGEARQGGRAEGVRRLGRAGVSRLRRRGARSGAEPRRARRPRRRTRLVRSAGRCRPRGR